jgi:uncharacterized protein (TIGR00369 family)
MSFLIEKQNPFFERMGFEKVHSDDEEMVLRLSIREDHHNVAGNLHGGVHAAILDSIQNLVLKTAYHCNVVIMNQNVQYLAAINKGDIYARAKIIQKGFKTAMTEAEIMDEQNRLIAKGTGVYKIIRASS